ncbi:MAG: UDP-glucose 4-epimerase GalE, partial [Muribaculaceae bacterium]|nr:UDP-glucose 4-epimerase GalE [Muribaculaceae bacterium]
MYYSNNLRGTFNILETMKKYGCTKFVFSSSATVYGIPETVPVKEDFPLSAINPYGSTKLIIENLCREMYASDSSWTMILLRYFNPVGAHPSALIGELPNGVPQNLIPYLTQTAMGVRPMLSVFGNDYPTPDGTCIRDFINVVDLAKAHVVAVERLVEDKCLEPVEVFNLGTGRGVSVLELINTFEEATGVKVPHQFAPRREGDITQVWADPTRANTVLGWKAETPLADTMVSAWRWQQRLREKGIM